MKTRELTRIIYNELYSMQQCLSLITIKEHQKFRSYVKSTDRRTASGMVEEMVILNMILYFYEMDCSRATISPASRIQKAYYLSPGRHHDKVLSHIGSPLMGSMSTNQDKSWDRLHVYQSS